MVDALSTEQIILNNYNIQYVDYCDWVCTAVMSNDVMKDLRGWYTI